MLAQAYKPFVRQYTQVFLWFFAPAILLSSLISGIVDKPTKNWSPTKQAHPKHRPIVMEGPREQFYAIYGKGIFEGGPRVKGDRPSPSKVWEKIPLNIPPNPHLKGFPISSPSPKRRDTEDSEARPASAVVQAVVAPSSVIKSARGFTLIELVMVILLLAVLAAVAIPNFNDFRSDARDSATKGALGGLRAALAIARAAIALKEDTTSPSYPTALEMQGNSYTGSHPILNALATLNKRILDPASGVPINPWSVTTIPTTSQASVWDCSALTKNLIRSGGESGIGWCYNTTTGEIWANSARNGQVSPNSENKF